MPQLEGDEIANLLTSTIAQNDGETAIVMAMLDIIFTRWARNNMLAGEVFRLGADGLTIDPEAVQDWVEPTAGEILAGTANRFPSAEALNATQRAEMLSVAGSVITADFAAGRNGSVTVNGAMTMTAPSGLVAAHQRASGVFALVSGTGTPAVSWHSNFDFGDAGAPVLSTTAGKIHLVTWYVHAVTPTPRILCGMVDSIY